MSKKKWNKWGYDGWGKKTYGMFQSEMTGTASVFGRDKGVEVTFNGTNTFVDGNIINFPSMDINVELKDDTITMCRGFVDHQSAKVRFSDRDLLSIKNTALKKENPLLLDLINSVETVRTENEYVGLYPGASKNIAELANEQARIFKTNNNISYGEKIPLSKIAPMAITSIGRKELGYWGFSLRDIVTHLEEVDKDIVEGWVDEINYCEDTAAAIKLAEKIYEFIKNNSDGEQDGEEKRVGSADTPSMEGILDREIKESDIPEFTRIGAGLPYTVATKEFDKIHHWSDPPPTSSMRAAASNPERNFAGQQMREAGNISAYMYKSNSLGPTINVARRKLELMIVAQRRVEWDYIKDRGKFDSKRMVAALSADPNVYKIKESAPEIDTAVSVVIDLSGSMNGVKRDVATGSAIVLFECLSKIGVPFEVGGFDTGYSCDDMTSAEYKKLKLMINAGNTAHGRYDSLHTYIFKSFKDRPFDARPYIMGIDNYGPAGGSNADGESIEIMHNRLLARPEKKKIMFVLSDGQPSCVSAENGQPWNHLVGVVKGIEKKGTHIIGIGIMTNVVEKFYSKYVVVKTPQDLAGTTLKLLSDLLLPKKKRALYV